MKRINAAKTKQKHSVASLVLGIIGTVFSVLIPLVTYACSIPGLIIAVRDKKRSYKANGGIVLNIVALVIAVINSVLAVAVALKLPLLDKIGIGVNDDEGIPF